jgi:hypothetical protein
MTKMNNTIKTLTVIAVIASAFTLQSFNTKKKEMKSKSPKIVSISKTSEIINTSADKVWEIVGPGFGKVGTWSTTVDHAEISGTPEFEGAVCTSRSCDLNAKGFSAINEKITAYDAKSHTLSFDIVEGVPGFVTREYSNWEVLKLSDNTSQLKVTTTMEMKKFMGSLMGGMIKKTIEKNIPLIQSDLKFYAETGEASVSKKARIASLNK